MEGKCNVSKKFVRVMYPQEKKNYDLHMFGGLLLASRFVLLRPKGESPVSIVPRQMNVLREVVRVLSKGETSLS